MSLCRRQLEEELACGEGGTHDDELIFQSLLWLQLQAETMLSDISIAFSFLCGDTVLNPYLISSVHMTELFVRQGNGRF